jgi:hypothetical protein
MSVVCSEPLCDEADGPKRRAVGSGPFLRPLELHGLAELHGRIGSSRLAVRSRVSRAVRRVLRVGG